jgi:hypothetical protein
VDLNKLTTSDKVIAGSGILLFIAYFLPWFKIDNGLGDSVSFNGGDVGFLFATLPMLIGLVMAGVVIASKMFDVKLPDLPVPWGQAHLGLGGLAALLVILKLLIGEDVFGFDLDRGFGLFVAVLAAIGLAAGGFMKYQAGEDAADTGGGTGSAPF